MAMLRQAIGAVLVLFWMSWRLAPVLAGGVPAAYGVLPSSFPLGCRALLTALVLRVHCLC